MSFSVNSVGYNTAVPFGQSTITQNDNSLTYMSNEIKNTEKKKVTFKDVMKGVGIGTAIAAAVDLVFFKGKHIKNIIKMFKKTKTPTTTTTPKAQTTKTSKHVRTTKAKTRNAKKPKTTPLQRAKDKNWEVAANKRPKNRQIKHTSDTGVHTPITESKMSQDLAKLETQNASAANRKAVEMAQRETVTPAQQAAHNREIAYQAPNKTQQKAMDALQTQNAEQRAVANSVANNSKGGERLANLQTQLKTEERIVNGGLKNGTYTLDGNRYVVKDGQFVEMQLANAPKPQVKQTKIYQHTDKNNVMTRLLAGEGEMANNLSIAA